MNSYQMLMRDLGDLISLVFWGLVMVAFLALCLGVVGLFVIGLFLFL